MTASYRSMLALAIALILLGSVFAALPPSATVRAGDAPSMTALAVRGALYDAQQAIGKGETAAAGTAIADAASGVATFVAMIPNDPVNADRLGTAMNDAESATASGDAIALAAARGTIWTAMLGAAYTETLAAVDRGDAGGAATWLLLREFRPTTKFARPGADATLAVQSFAAGTMMAPDVAHAITADLLDTYQSKLDEDLAVLLAASQQAFGVRQAETAAAITGYWAILAPAYAAQTDPARVSSAQATIDRLGQAVTIGDATATAQAITEATALSRSFRAAPLSNDEMARRAGQLLRYLSLVPVEYGRGVKNGTVILDIEIQEAQTFLDAARASFTDLYLYLNTQDPEATAAIDATLAAIDTHLRDAAAHTTVADHDVIAGQVDDIVGSLTSIFPAEWTRDGSDADFDVISSLLDQVEAAAAAGQWTQAESARLEAYAIYELGAEKRLLAFAPDLANRTEQLFWQGTGSQRGLAIAIQDHASPAEIAAIRAELDTALAESQQRLGAGRPATAVVVFNAATIVFREGLEAVLILASLIASMIGANQKYKRPLAAGAALAFAATAALFVLAQTVLSSLAQYGEKLEAIVSIIAVAVLLLIMNWFFHKVYWTRWIGKHHEKRRMVIGGAAGQALGLVTLGFTSVFREGAETVLFLQALVLDAGVWVVIQGTALGLVATAIVGLLVFALQKKLPHKKMLMVTGAMIALVLVTMVGNTVHVMQVVGWAPITAVDGLSVPFWAGQWFGIYAVWESLLAQAIALALVFGSYFGSELVTRRERRRMIADLRATEQLTHPA